MKALLLVVAAGAAGYVLLALAAYLLQDRLLYYPSLRLHTTPDESGFAFESVTLATDDGERVHAWWIPAPRARGTLLFCHGNAGNLSNRLPSIDIFRGLGLNVLIFDYRGYGQSTGRPSEAGLYRDAEAAWRYLTETRAIRPAEVVVFGRSLGGGVATWVASRHAPGALIVESAFTSVPDVAALHYPFLPVRLLARARYDSAARIGTVRAPVLVIHSPADEIVPYRLGRRLFDAAAEPKAFLPIDGGHNDGFFVTGRRYVDGLDAFVTGRLGPGPTAPAAPRCARGGAPTIS
jgi:fermentation-respiration switch protein FrsA (DUF1100 family)